MNWITIQKEFIKILKPLIIKIFYIQNMRKNVVYVKISQVNSILKIMEK